MLRKACNVWSHNQKLAVLVFLLGTVLATSSAAQSYLEATGSPSFATNIPAPLGYADIANGNLHLEIPIASFPQRGKLIFAPRFVYDSRIWTIVDSGTSKSWQPTNVSNAQLGWRFVTGAEAGQVTWNAAARPNKNCYPWTYYLSYSGFTWTDPNGTKHKFPISTRDEDLDPGCGGEVIASGSALATDGSGYSMAVTDFTSATVYAPDGTRVFPTLMDRNGNYFGKDSSGNTIDTLGRTPVMKSTRTSGSDSYADYAISGPSDTRWTVTVHSAPIQVTTAFGISGTTEYNQSVTAIQDITVPGVGNYTFNYDSYGQISSITLPTGGVVTYAHATFTDSYATTNRWISNFKLGSDAATLVTPSVLSSCSSGTVGCQQQVSVRRPLGDRANYVFTLNNGAWQTQLTYLDSGNQQQGSVSNTWDTSNACPEQGCTGSAYIKIVSSTTTIPNGTGSLSRKTQYSYDSAQRNNLIAVKEWDYASGGFSAIPDRETDLTYLADSRYTALNIWNLTTSVTVKNKAGDTLSQTTVAYDEGTVSNVADVPNHDASYSASFKERGNPTTITNLVDPTTNATISWASIYDILGNVVTMTDAGGHTSNFGYTTVGGMLQSVSLPKTNTGTVDHNSSITYDGSTGLVTRSRDENGKDTTYSYDSYGRASSIDYADGGQVVFSYPDNRTASVTKKVDALKSRTSFVWSDAFGRTVRAGTQSTTGTYDQQDTCYDQNGRRRFSTYPYSGSGPSGSVDCSQPGDTYGYDSLDRLTQLTHSDSSAVNLSFVGRARSVIEESNGSVRRQRIFQNNAFGQLVSVCEVYAGNDLRGNRGSAEECGQDIPLKGFLTSYTYDVMGNLLEVAQGDQRRNFAYDALSRLTKMTDPESGETSFTYNGDGTLATRVRPRQNQSDGNVKVTATYSYDELHRVTAISYDDGLTPTITNEYDLSSAFGQTIDNPVGRLVRSSTPQVVVGFNYDSVGRVKTNWQRVSTQRAVAYSYDLEGNLLSQTNGLGTTLTFENDLGGRPLKVTSSLVDTHHPGILFQNATYNSSGALLSAKLGNDVTRMFSYNQRGMLTGQQDITNTLPANGSTGYVDITGSEQSKLTGGTGGSAGSGTVTISGSERSYIPDSCGALAPSGSSISTQSVTPQSPVCPRVYDSGTVTVTVNGFTVSVSYRQGSTGSTIASAIGSGFNVLNSPVNVSVSTNVITLTAKTIGANTNYSLTTSSMTNDPANFGGPSFTASRSGATLTGGTDPTGQVTVYDNGTVGITVGAFAKSVSYGQNSTSATIAGALASVLNGDTNSPVTATASSTRLNLASKATGAGANYSLATTSATQNSNFSSPSFTAAPSGATMTGGTDGGTLYQYTLDRASNGNVTSANDKVNGSWTYGYDEFDRIKTANKSGSTQLSFSFDRYGNRWDQEGGGGTVPNFSFDLSNRILLANKVSYDAAGNVKWDGSFSYCYDAENRLLRVVNDSSGDIDACNPNSTPVASYTYDPNGLRVEVVKGSDTRESIYDLAGRDIAEVTPSGSWMRGEIYVGGEHLATYVGGTTYFLHTDWLGTMRALTLPDASVANQCTSLPYGDGQSCTNSTGFRNFFTDYSHDSETNLDHSWFRQYSSRLGRYHSPDAIFGSIANPQSLNRYAYVQSDPVNFVDPNGLQLAAPDVTHHGGFGFGNCYMDGFNYDCSTALDASLGFGWTNFDLFETAFTPTAAVIYPDPEFPFSDNSRIVFEYGNWDLLMLLGGEIIWSPWYTVTGTLEGRGANGELHLNPKTSYGFNPSEDLFVALPDTMLKGQCIDIAAGGKVVRGVPVGDVGPWNGGGTRSNPWKFNDPYWSPGDTRFGGFHSPQTMSGNDLRGRTVARYARGAGIDISYGLQQQLGLKGNSTVSWRFTSCD